MNDSRVRTLEASATILIGADPGRSRTKVTSPPDDFFGFPAIQPHHPPRHERDAYLRSCAAQFAGNLESIVKRDPLQWYNFFPFWDQPTPTGRIETTSPAVVSQPEAAARVN